MLRFENLCKRYDERVIFQGLRYNAGTGCVALNDESGSGKSTLLAILAGEIEPDQGEVWVDGHSLRHATLDAKVQVAYVPDDCMPNSQQTGREYLEQVALNRKTIVESQTLDLADRFGLTPHLGKRFEQMSFGTRKKIFLTAAALGDVKVVIADEPCAGLDAPARAVLIDLFRMLGKDRTVFFSSYDEDFTQACGAKMISFAELVEGT